MPQGVPLFAFPVPVYPLPHLLLFLFPLRISLPACRFLFPFPIPAISFSAVSKCNLKWVIHSKVSMELCLSFLMNEVLKSLSRHIRMPKTAENIAKHAALSSKVTYFSSSNMLFSGPKALLWHPKVPCFALRNGIFCPLKAYIYCTLLPLIA